MLLDVTQEDRTLYISYYNLNGDTRFKTYDVPRHEMFNWEVCDPRDTNQDNIIKNWDGRPVKKSRSKFLNKFRIMEFIHNNVPESDRNTIFGYHFPKIYFVDIEVEVTDSFPEPSKAENKITTICIVTPSKQCIILATKDVSKEQQSKIQDQIDEHFKEVDHEFSFIFKVFKSEYDMLYTFLKSFVSKFPMMTGWNFVKFDWQYIVNRSKKIGIDATISSPIARQFGRDDFPCHVGVMDYLDIYAKWDRTVDVKEDFKLDTVGDAVIGIKKIKYDGTLQDLYEKEYPKYLFYNAVDTALVFLIHEKIKTMHIALTIAHMSKISIFKASSPVAITEALLCRKFLEHGKVMAKDPRAGHSKREQFQGAFVKEPKVGMHKAVACFDFASLYPSIMRQMNVSPESFVKKVKPDLKDNERSKDKIVAVTGAVYDKKDSILKEILTELYSQRKEYKRKSFELQQKAYEMEKQEAT